MNLMQMEHLKSYGLPEIVVASWRERLGEELLPLQRRAVIENRILAGENVLVCAPTSSGKTFCGELAATAAIFNRRKALFLVPLKSIAEERYREFANRYRKLGIRVVISTGDHREFEHDLENGKFDLGILVYEKFNQLLIRNLDLLASVGLIVIDEVQMIGDCERGATLELAILKTQHSQYHPQIVALSAVLDNAEELAAWLGCRLLVDHFRPVELRHGVLYQGRYRYRCADGHTTGEEVLSDCNADDPEELLLTNIETLVNSGEQVLVFLKAKRACEILASRLSERNFWPEAQSTIEQLQRETTTILGRRLAETLQSGVAFHHADLSHRQRRTLERGYLNGEIKVLVSTTTLAMGVNLPAQTVFIDCYKYQPGRHGQRAVVAPLGWSEYEAMSGRAGRYGRGAQFGRSVLIANSDIEAETLWKLYVEGCADSVGSSLQSLAMADVILDLVSARVINKVSEIAPTLQSTFFASVEGAIDDEWITESLERLKSQRMVFIKKDEISASPMGQLASLRGIGSASLFRLTSQLREYDGGDRLSWLYSVAMLPDFEITGLYLDASDDYGKSYRSRLTRYLNEHSQTAPWLMRLVDDEYLLTERELLGLKATFLLCEWSTAIETADLELRYKTHCGAMLQMSETAAWLVDSLAELAELLHQPKGQIAQLRTLAHVTGRGFDLPGSIFDAAGFDAENRDLVWRLFNAGYVTTGQFTQEKRAKLAALIGDAAAEYLITKFGELRKRNSAESNSEEETMPLLKLRGLLKGERVRICFNEAEIDLTPKSFNYLYKLGAARFLKPEGWMSKEEIEPGFNQAKNIYRVKQELKRFATGLENMIENNKSGFYRLNLKPEQIKIDVESMEAYSDFELAELTKRLSNATVS